ncbi:hypothetical protein PUNSTDRAFT_128571 [Punctularia strigosozonata HHB-11173 SS5]|uniref:Uncharacterized protein n=1 Tax=Punctularia strigosozonata (strain HHB-11173) TaxID=741275 RepID=R7S0Z8_PUNST|nr:uncharacterized protein PUNSTDRAFT_128571 [Punctularia strigosozonata HHB-11173 SS5]EIN04055.1 hypothetical protein PUNSTDRAFT_128571 [Punctularia strigosozonata HHB-11173 SS5]
MSCVAVLPPPPASFDPFHSARKRTHSFSMPKPAKSARTLQRTVSFIELSDAFDDNSDPEFAFPSIPATRAESSSARSLRAYKEARARRYVQDFKTEEMLSLSSASLAALFDELGPSSVITFKPKPRPPLFYSSFRHRTSSPLSPVQKLLPARPVFPRSKPDSEADLHRRAIVARMRCSPEGQKILMMGARVAISMMSATRELEALVAAREGSEGHDAPTKDSRTPVGQPEEDWELIDS